MKPWFGIPAAAAALLNRAVPRFSTAAASECGLVRAENQDAYFLDVRRGVFCVADGMGGGQGGAVASKIVCDAVASAATGFAGTDLAEKTLSLTTAVEKANSGIREYAARAHYASMGSTVAGIVAGPASGNRGVVEAAVFHAGDSRIYRYRAGRLERLTSDHSLAEDRVVAGELGFDVGAASPYLRRTKFSHIITRGVGIAPATRLEWRRVDVAPGDMFLLCSDGVYDMVPDNSIRFAFATGRTPSGTIDLLARKIVAAGAKDNYTMIVAAVRRGFISL